MGSAAKHSLIVIASFFITSLLNYGFGVVLSWYYDPAEYGVLGIAQSLLLLFVLVVGSGFTWTITQEIASNGLSEYTRLRFRSAVVFNSLLGCLLALSLWGMVKVGWIPIESSYQMVLPLVGLTTVVLSVRSIVNGAARGLYLFGQVSYNLVFEVLVKVCSGLVLVMAGWGVEGVLVGFLAGAVVSLFHSLWLTRSAGLWRGELRLDHGIIRRTVPLFMGVVGTALMINLDLLGIKIFYPAGQSDTIAGYYQAAVILARAPVFIAQALTIVLFSYAAGVEVQAGQGDPLDGKNWYFLRALRMWVRLLIPINLILILIPSEVLLIFFPPTYQLASQSLQVAAVGGILLACVTLLTGVFQAENKRRQPALAAGLAVFAQVILLAWLVPRYGAIGAAVSLVTAGAVALLGLFPLIKGRVNLRRSHWIETSIKLCLPYLSLILPLVLLPGSNRTQALLKISLSIIAYLGCLAILGLKPVVSVGVRPDIQRFFKTRIYQLIQTLIGG